ncbi:FAD-dependent oxidoreductase [Spirochaetia bacterium]|nr:FAD-dependent oxidoreductase [Spirochaetia bacterium]
MTAYEVIVVGGGYFGCSAAYHLASAGVPTLLVEGREIASGASGANFGNVQVQDSNMGLSLTLTLEGFKRIQNMEAQLGLPIGYKTQPSLIGAECEAHLPELRRLYEEKKAAGLDIRWLEGREITEIEPNLAPGAVAAATYYEQGSVYPFHYMFALITRGREHGLTVRENAEVQSLFTEGGACCGVVLAGGEVIRANQVVVAAGAGARALCQSVGLDVPVQSVKAEGMVTEAIKPFLRTYYASAAFFAEAHSQDEAATSLCIGQSRFGNILLAETTKPPDWVPEKYRDTSSLAHIRNLREKVLRFFPALRDIQVLRSWVTASPYTDSCEPVLGFGGVPGVIVAAGFKSAVILSAVAGEIVRDLATKGTCSYDLDVFTRQIRVSSSL